jgi:hypothetical protein
MRWLILGAAVALFGAVPAKAYAEQCVVTIKALDGKGNPDPVHSKWRTATVTGKDSKGNKIYTCVPYQNGVPPSGATMCPMDVCPK